MCCLNIGGCWAFVFTLYFYTLLLLLLHCLWVPCALNSVTQCCFFNCAAGVVLFWCDNHFTYFTASLDSLCSRRSDRGDDGSGSNRISTVVLWQWIVSGAPVCMTWYVRIVSPCQTYNVHCYYYATTLMSWYSCKYPLRCVSWSRKPSLPHNFSVLFLFLSTVNREGGIYLPPSLLWTRLDFFFLYYWTSYLLFSSSFLDFPTRGWVHYVLGPEANQGYILCSISSALLHPPSDLY